MMRSLWTILSAKHRGEAAQVFVLMVLVSCFEMMGVGVVLPLAIVLVEPRRAATIPALRWLAQATGFGFGPNFAVFLSVVLLSVIIVKGAVVTYGYRRQYRFAFGLQKDLADRLLTGYLVAPLSLSSDSQ